MKANIVRRRSGGTLFTIGFVVVVLVAAALFFGYERLRAIWLEQCVVTDMARQVAITSGKMVKADVVAGIFGLRPGANLGEIDYAARREEVLRRIPNLKAISVSRMLPDRVSIVTEERKPIARLNLRGERRLSGRVVDDEGVVFDCIPGTSMLPTIRESAPGTSRGHRLDGRARAALQLIEACRAPEYLCLGLLEVDLSKSDCLVATLGNYSRAHIAWNGMSEATDAARADLNRRLDHLVKTIRSQIGTGITIWDVSDLSHPGHVYAR